MSSGFVTRMLWTYWRQEMSRVRAASAVRNDSSAQALQTKGKDDDDWTLRGMFNTGLDLRRSGLQRAQTLVRDSDFETATMSSQELFTALEVTICTVIWIDLKLLLHGNLLERHLVSPIPDDAVENILHAVNYEAGRHLDRRWDSQRMFPSNSTARDVDQLVLDCCAVDMHQESGGMHDSMDEVFETLEPACKQIDELAGTRRILSTLVRWFESVDMLQFQGQLANAKSVLHHDIDRGIEELRAFVASEDKPIFPQLLALRRMIVEWRDLDEVQKACEGTVVVQSLEDFVDGEDDAEDGRSLNNHEDY